jgi:methyl-accepting chemotaxis protein
MDSQTIRHVQSTWTSVESIAPQAAALFYQNLFEADPALRPLFKGDMSAQGKKLMLMIGVAVNKLNDLDTLIPALRSLAVRHVGYGVVNAHYATVGSALLKTLEQGLGPAFTPEVKQAWTTVYQTMASVMMQATEAA